MFVSDQAGNPEDRFCLDTPHLIKSGEPCHEKTCPRGFRPVKIEISLIKSYTLAGDIEEQKRC